MHIVILVTTTNRQQAETIAEKLVEKRLIACANILEGVQSMFCWEGKTERSQEVMLMLKTAQKHFDAIEVCIKKMHSYSIPEIIALPIADGSIDYLKWIDESIADEGGGA